MEHLEFCLRVYHNEGKDNVPLATAATILRKQVVLAFDLQDLDPSDRAPAGQAAAHILIGALAMPPLHQPVDGTSPVYLQGWNVSAWVSQEGVTSFQVKSSAMEAPMAQAVQHRLSSTVVASTTSLSRAFSGCSSRALSNARLSALSASLPRLSQTTYPFSRLLAKTLTYVLASCSRRRQSLRILSRVTSWKWA